MTGPTSKDATGLGAIRATGADAGEFLRAQLTNDIRRLGPDRHFLAAWCDPKGRVLAVMRVVATADHYLLILPRALVAAIRDRLQMYVLRAAVTLTDVSDDYRFDGIAGASSLPPVNRCENARQQLLLGLPRDSLDTPRALALTPAGNTPPTGGVAIDSDTWQLTGIDAGVPAIYPQTRNLFVPQMLNLHWLSAIDFDKGCFPGQEVVARLHYRGRLTRRSYRLAWSGPRPAIAAEIIDDKGKRQGSILRVAATSEDAGRLLAVVKVSAAHAALSATGETRLDLLDLPYPTPD